MSKYLRCLDLYLRTPLMAAISHKHEEVVRLLLAQPGIDVNIKDENKLSALHFACQEHDRDVALAILPKLLAVPGLLLNSRDGFGQTPIMLAVLEENTTAVRLMAAEEGVDLDVRSHRGESLEDLNNR